MPGPSKLRDKLLGRSAKPDPATRRLPEWDPPTMDPDGPQLTASLQHILDQDLPVPEGPVGPEQPGGADDAGRSRNQALRDARSRELLEAISGWIARIQDASPELQRRYALGRGLQPKRDTSKRYDLIKHEFDATQRTSIGAALEDHVDRNPGPESDWAVEVLVGLRDAQFKVHSADQQAEQTRKEKQLAVHQTVKVVMTGGLATPFAMRKGYLLRKRYERENFKPEHGQALNGLIKLAGNTALSDKARDRAAEMILDNLRRNTVAAADRNWIMAHAFLEGPGLPKEPRRHDRYRIFPAPVIKVPPKGTDEQEAQILARIRAFSETGYRSVDTPEVEAKNKQLDTWFQKINTSDRTYGYNRGGKDVSFLMDTSFENHPPSEKEKFWERLRGVVEGSPQEIRRKLLKSLFHGLKNYTGSSPESLVKTINGTGFMERMPVDFQQTIFNELLKNYPGAASPGKKALLVCFDLNWHKASPAGQKVIANTVLDSYATTDEGGKKAILEFIMSRPGNFSPQEAFHRMLVDEGLSTSTVPWKHMTASQKTRSVNEITKNLLGGFASEHAREIATLFFGRMTAAQDTMNVINAVREHTAAQGTDELVRFILDALPEVDGVQPRQALEDFREVMRSAGHEAMTIGEVCRGYGAADAGARRAIIDLVKALPADFPRSSALFEMVKGEDMTPLYRARDWSSLTAEEQSRTFVLVAWELYKDHPRPTSASSYNDVARLFLGSMSDPDTAKGMYEMVFQAPGRRVDQERARKMVDELPAPFRTSCYWFQALRAMSDGTAWEPWSSLQNHDQQGGIMSLIELYGRSTPKVRENVVPFIESLRGPRLAQALTGFAKIDFPKTSRIDLVVGGLSVSQEIDDKYDAQDLELGRELAGDSGSGLDDDALRLLARTSRLDTSCELIRKNLPNLEDLLVGQAVLELARLPGSGTLAAPLPLWLALIEAAPRTPSAAFGELLVRTTEGAEGHLAALAERLQTLMPSLPEANRQALHAFADLASQSGLGWASAFEPLRSPGSDATRVSPQGLTTLLPYLSSLPASMQEIATASLHDRVQDFEKLDAAGQESLLSIGLNGKDIDFLKRVVGAQADRLGQPGTGEDRAPVTLNTVVYHEKVSSGDPNPVSLMRLIRDQINKTSSPFDAAAAALESALRSLAARYADPAVEEERVEILQLLSEGLPELSASSMGLVLETLALTAPMPAKGALVELYKNEPDLMPKERELGSLMATLCLSSPEAGWEAFNELQEEATGKGHPDWLRPTRPSPRAKDTEEAALNPFVRAMCLADPARGAQLVDKFKDRLTLDDVMRNVAAKVTEGEVESRRAAELQRQRDALSKSDWRSNGGASTSA